MIPGGWNSQREASITQYDSDPVEHAMEDKEMIPGGWNIQREANNTQYIQTEMKKVKNEEEKTFA